MKKTTTFLLILFSIFAFSQRNPDTFRDGLRTPILVPFPRTNAELVDMNASIGTQAYSSTDSEWKVFTVAGWVSLGLNQGDLQFYARLDTDNDFAGTTNVVDPVNPTEAVNLRTLESYVAANGGGSGTVTETQSLQDVFDIDNNLLSESILIGSTDFSIIGSNETLSIGQGEFDLFSNRISLINDTGDGVLLENRVLNFYTNGTWNFHQLNIGEGAGNRGFGVKVDNYSFGDYYTHQAPTENGTYTLSVAGVAADVNGNVPLTLNDLGGSSASIEGYNFTGTEANSDLELVIGNPNEPTSKIKISDGSGTVVIGDYTNSDTGYYHEFQGEAFRTGDLGTGGAFTHIERSTITLRPNGVGSTSGLNITMETPNVNDPLATATYQNRSGTVAYLDDINGSGHTIQFNGVVYATQPNLNFKGDVFVDNNINNNSTDLTIMLSHGLSANNTVEKLTAVGGETTWTLNNTPATTANNKLYIGGLLQSLNTDYSITDNIVTFLGVNNPLAAGDNLEFHYNITGTGDINATDITVDSSGFDGNLATTDNDLQKVAQKLDDLVVSGGATGPQGPAGADGLDGLNAGLRYADLIVDHHETFDFRIILDFINKTITLSNFNHRVRLNNAQTKRYEGGNQVINFSGLATASFWDFYFYYQQSTDSFHIGQRTGTSTAGDVYDPSNTDHYLITSWRGSANQRLSYNQHAFKVINTGVDYIEKVTILGDSHTNGGATWVNEMLRNHGAINEAVRLGFNGSMVADLFGNSFYDRRTQIAADTELLIIFGGTNDFIGNAVVGAVQDGGTYDVTTTVGSLQAIIEYAYSINPAIQIMLFAPVHHFTAASGGTQLDVSAYTNGIKSTGEYYNVPVLDIDSVMNINRYNYTEFFGDAIHLNETSRIKLGRISAEFVRNNY